MHWPFYVISGAALGAGAGIFLAIRHYRATMRIHASLRAEGIKRTEEGRLHAESRYTLDRLRAQRASLVDDGPDGGHRKRIDELLDVLARAEAPRSASFPVSGPCAEVIDSFRASAGERELLYSESGDGRWLQVRGDRDLLRWAVHEIFRNVVEHAEGWSRITVKAEPVEGSILLTIRDDGCGLDRTAASRIYTAFSPRLGSNGPGVGLFVVRHIVESFGGTAEARSAPGGGVLHSLRIPHPAEGPYGVEEPRRRVARA
jgi:signal transduction histidine kinase